MRKRLKFASRYFKYWLFAKHNTTSVFVNSIIKEVLKANQKFYSFKEIEGIRSVLKKNNSTIKITDLELEALLIILKKERSQI